MARTFGDAFRAARKSVGLTQADLGARIGIGMRAVIRWERDEARPSNAARDAAVAWLRSLDGSNDARDALVALGVLVPASPSRKRSLSADERRAAKSAIDLALLGAAEAHDVNARAARLVVDAVLAAIEASDVPVSVARDLVAPARPAKSKR